MGLRIEESEKDQGSLIEFPQFTRHIFNGQFELTETRTHRQGNHTLPLVVHALYK